MCTAVTTAQKEEKEIDEERREEVTKFQKYADVYGVRHVELSLINELKCKESHACVTTFR